MDNIEEILNLSVDRLTSPNGRGIDTMIDNLGWSLIGDGSVPSVLTINMFDANNNPQPVYIRRIELQGDGEIGETERLQSDIMYQRYGSEDWEKYKVNY